MLRTAFQQIRTLWIVLRALRTGLSGAFLVCVMALFVVPATQQEQTTFRFTDDSDVQLTLTMHRIGKALVTADSDRLYDAIADSAPNDLATWQVRLLAGELAKGSMQFDKSGEVRLNAAGTTQTLNADTVVRAIVPPAEPDSLLAPRSSGAKFVSARTN